MACSTSDLRVLLLGGSVELAADWPKEIGAVAHLPEPFPIDDLNQSVRSLLDG